MPLRKPTDDEHNEVAQGEPATVPPEAYQYEAELNVLTVQKIQARADKVLSTEEWVVIDGVDKQ